MKKIENVGVAAAAVGGQHPLENNLKRGSNQRIAQRKTEGVEEAKAPAPADVAETHEDDFDEDSGTPVVPVEIRSSDACGKVGDAASHQKQVTDDPAHEMLLEFADTFIAVIVKSGRRWVAINDICDHLGVILDIQRSHLCADARFHWKEFQGVDLRCRECKLFCVAAEQFSAWISRIDLSCLEPDVVHRFLSYRLAAINEFCDLHRFPKPPEDPMSLDSRLQRLEVIAARTFESVSVVNRFFMQFAEYELMRHKSLYGSPIASPHVGGEVPATQRTNKTEKPGGAGSPAHPFERKTENQNI